MLRTILKKRGKTDDNRGTLRKDSTMNLVVMSMWTSRTRVGW